jgi:hypothetical protein
VAIVDLPEPEGPTSAVTVPSRRTKETSSRASSEDHVVAVGHDPAAVVVEHGGVEEVDDPGGRRPRELRGPHRAHHDLEAVRDEQGDQRGGEDVRGRDLAEAHQPRPSPDVDEQDERDGQQRRAERADGDEGAHPVVVEVLEVLRGLLVGTVRAAHPAESLDHRDAGDELDHARRDDPEPPVHLDRLLSHAAHAQGHRRGVQGHGRDGQQAEPPVDREGVHHQRQRHDDGDGPVDRLVRDEVVDRRDVVLQGLAHPAGVGGGEPRQPGAGEAADHAPADEVPEPDVGQVRDEERADVHEQAKAEGGEQDAQPEAHGIAVDVGAPACGLKQDRPDPDEGDVGHDREHPRDDRK